MYARIPPNPQLHPIDLVAPGFKGLNLSNSAGVMSPAFCAEAQNAVIDAEGRLRARAGFTSVTSDTIDSQATIKTIFGYLDSNGIEIPIVAWDGGISDDLTDPESNDISGAVDDSDGTWKFVNFNNKCVGFQDGLIPIVYNGSGTFAEITEASGTAPSSGIGCAAYGRLWAADSDLQTIQYSALLDETRWDAADGGGVIDMRNVWPDGMDVITAIESFNGFLIVFGKRSIVVWASQITGALGLDPTELFVQDVITGIGTLSQFSVQKVGRTDLVFLSSEGVMSMQRLLVQKSAPVAELSKNVRDAIVANAQSQSMLLIRSTYNPYTGFYLLSMPTIGITWALDQRRRFMDEEGTECSIVTRWSVAPTALFTRQNNSMLASIGNGAVHQYSGTDDAGAQYRFIYKSPWLDLGEDLANRLKILKRLGAILYVSSDTQVVFKWSADFREDVFNTTTVAAGTSGTLAEWGTAEYGIGEFGGGLALRILKVAARGTAQYFRLGIEAQISGDFSLQQAELFTKIGRLA